MMRVTENMNFDKLTLYKYEKVPLARTLQNSPRNIRA